MTLNGIQNLYITSKLKPIVNARPAFGQFSVLAGIYASWPGHNEVLCLSTGVKCVPDIKLQNTKGMVLHDSHAEVLTVRSFNLLMLELIIELKNGKSNSIIELNAENGLYKLKDGVELHMYISELPCGDASLESFIENDSTPWDLDDSEGTFRGRSNYTHVGKVRTKPGRKDSPISLSKSCSDKLTVFCIKGLLNSAVQDLFEDPIYLKEIIVPEITFSVTRCFHGRLPSQFKDLNKTKITASDNELEFRTILEQKKMGLLTRPTNNEKANELGIVYLPTINYVEVVNAGVKNGNGVKRVIKTKKGFSAISRFALIEKRKQIGIKGLFKTHKEFKSSLGTYKEFKSAIKRSLGDWGKSTNDDFNL